jgi:two-component system, sporulation sensor kinase B
MSVDNIKFNLWEVIRLDITKHLFFNLSLLIIFLVVCLIWSMKREEAFFSKTAAIVCGVAAVGVCIVFSYESSATTRFDIRAVPVVIGGLYAGIGGILAGSAIIIRALYGFDSGFFLGILLYAPLGYLLWRLYPWFWNQSSKVRIVTSVGLTFLISLLTVSPMIIGNYSIDRFDAYFAFLFVPPVGIGITTYAIEFVRKNLHMRKRLYQSEKLAAVEQMGAAISHEIRNPLTVANGFVQLLEDDSLTSVKRKEYLGLIKDGLHSAERVIQDYLTFSKPTIKKMEKLDVGLEINHTINILMPTANQHSVQLSAKLLQNIFIKGDPHKFRQCLLNILKNGIESMPNGGCLTIVMKSADALLHIEISDTGTGMTKQQINRLGEPYYSSKGAKGTGLGTMVAYSIVRAMKGSISVKSELGKGTTFHLYFPICSKEDL